MNLERIVADLTEKIENRFYGKYRATVVDNQDPVKLGRLKLNVPSVLGGDVVTGWATPCAPYGGAADQGFLYIPEVGAGVWVEFEEGDLEFPIWVGCYWSQPNGDTEIPKPNKDSDGTEESSVQDPPTSKIIKTLKGHTLQFEDADGAEMILITEGAQGHFLTMDKNGITITDANSNTIVFSSSGIKIEDTNQNTIEMTSDGIKITATTGQNAPNNVINMSSSGFTITAVKPLKIDATGQPVTIIGKTVDFQKG